MSKPRHLVSIDDLSLAEMQGLFGAAKRFSEDLTAHANRCPGRITASLFYEASTRTRLSFESAMLRLGGGVITAADMRASSASKGESLADTVRVVGGGYADLLVLRHPSEGAARLAAQYSPVPVVNAGDGSHEHPTQTLCDLYSLWVERGRIEGLDVVLAGDLRYSRTIHSFCYALARFGANILCVPQGGFELPDYVMQRLREEFGVEPVRANASKMGELAAESDVVYMTPQKPHQLSLFTDAKGWNVSRVDAVYMTRPQTERHREGEGEDRSYLHLGKSALDADSLRDAVVMHPLPRRDEISDELDADPRSIYFKQAARGVPIRMAILAALLGELDVLEAPPAAGVPTYPVREGRNPCPNANCISNTETRHVGAQVALTSRLPLRVQCAYCSHRLAVGAVGCLATRTHHAPGTPGMRQIRPEDMVFFPDAAAAERAGFAARSQANPV